MAVALALALMSGCEPAATEPSQAATPARVRLLTAEQYSNTLAALFGEEVAASVIPPVPPLARTDGLLAAGAASVGLTSDQLSQIQLAAASIARRVVDEDHRTFLLPCAPEALDEADESCARVVLADFAPRMLRRPVEDERLDALVELATRGAAQLGGFHDGLALALEALLLNPDFLFLVDRTEADPAAPQTPRLDAWSLASRLSYFLWNGPPDGPLLEAAANGSLHTQAGLEAAVDRMLASPRLEAGMRAFFDDMFAFDEFDSLAKDPTVYPMVTGATLRDAREQTLRTVIHHLLDVDADYRDLYTTRETFMSMPLAALYGVPADQGWSPHTFAEDDRRSGLLTHVSFLASHSHSVRSSPTLRGRALRELFLCQRVPDPPPNVDFSKIEDAGDVATARERLAVHNEVPSCAGCHLITDPMGLSLENFDGAGRWRDTENGAALDVAGELDGVFYDDVDGLAVALSDHPKLPFCLVRRLYAYGSGGPVELRHDRPSLDWFTERFEADGFRLRSLLRTLATSQAFVRVRPGDASSPRTASSARDAAAEQITHAFDALRALDELDPAERVALAVSPQRAVGREEQVR